MGRSRSSKNWLQQHFTDEYVRRSWKDGYRSRAVYKLIEIQEKDKIIKPGQIIVDLGSNPGSWSQYAANLVGKRGKVISLDILPMEPLPGVIFIQGDFKEESVLNKLMAIIENYNGIDLVISDIAPNSSGMKIIDQPRRMYLAELAYDFALNNLNNNGSFLCKIFHGIGFDDLLKSAQRDFKKVYIRKPKASRARSMENYLLARELK